MYVPCSSKLYRCCNVKYSVIVQYIVYMYVCIYIYMYIYSQKYILRTLYPVPDSWHTQVVVEYPMTEDWQRDVQVQEVLQTRQGVKHRKLCRDIEH